MYVRLNPGENMPAVEHRISPSNSAEGTFISVDLHRNKSTESFQFGTKSQIAAHHTVYREGRRISKFNNSFLNFQIKKDDDLKTYIVLTAKGNDLYHKQVTKRSLHLIFNELTEEEKKHLDSILTKVRDTTCGLLRWAYKPPFLP